MTASVATRSSAATLRRRNGRLAIILSALLFIGLSLGVADFFAAVNLTNIVQQNSALLTVALGQTFVIIAGGLDVSVGSVISLTTVILSLDLPWPLTTALALLAGLSVGLVNGLGIVRGVHPIIMTLSTMSIVQGVALAIREVPGGTVPVYLTWMMATELLGVPLTFFWSVALAPLLALILYHTVLGIRLYALGAAPGNAAVAGVATARIIVIVYMLSALTAVLAGMQLAGRIGTGEPLVGAVFAVDAITAVALGGTLLSGGIGSIGGTVAGVVLLALIANGMNHLDVPVFYQQVLKGLLLVAVVCFYRRREPGL
jgi:ribose transport system permease protein